MQTEASAKTEFYQTVVLVPLTEKAKRAIRRDKLEVNTFPFKIGRESRHANEPVPPHILEKRTGKVPPNNDFYMIDDGRMLNISREHFLIERAENGNFMLFDRMSSCGTIVRSKQGDHTCIAHKCPISDGDEVIVGISSSPYKFKVEIVDNAETAEAMSACA